mgnify:CR=1 FL=1
MPKKEQIIAAILMSLFMAFALSGYFAVLKMGFTPGWGAAWFSGFISVWPVALILVLLIGKPVSLLARRIAEKLP